MVCVDQVVPSRIIMAIPNMGFTPVIMAALESRSLFLTYPILHLPITTLVTGSASPSTHPLSCHRAFFLPLPRLHHKMRRWQGYASDFNAAMLRHLPAASRNQNPKFGARPAGKGAAAYLWRRRDFCSCLL